MLFGAKSELHGEISLKTFVRVQNSAWEDYAANQADSANRQKIHSRFIYTTISFMLSHCDLIFIFWQNNMLTALTCGSVMLSFSVILGHTLVMRDVSLDHL